MDGAHRCQEAVRTAALGRQACVSTPVRGPDRSQHSPAAAPAGNEEGTAVADLAYIALLVASFAALVLILRGLEKV